VGVYEQNAYRDKVVGVFVRFFVRHFFVSNYDGDYRV
jgi:hypothetical protein